MLPLIVTLLAGCRSDIAIYRDPCIRNENVVTADRQTVLGFSADDAVAWFGDEIEADVRWNGRHSRTPARDTVRGELGEITGDIVVHTATLRPDFEGDPDPFICSDGDAMVFRRAATWSTADGGVAGEGDVELRVPALDHDQVEFIGRTREATLSEARMAEVDAVVEGENLQPPTTFALYVVEALWYAEADIVAEGPNYGISVWKCNGQKDSGEVCMDVVTP